MPAYMYSITINRSPKSVFYHRSVKLEDGTLSLRVLREIVTEDEVFSVAERDGDSQFEVVYTLEIDGWRMETEEEVSYRVVMEERYMEEYRKRHPLRFKRD